MADSHPPPIISFSLLHPHLLWPWVAITLAYHIIFLFLKFLCAILRREDLVGLWPGGWKREGGEEDVRVAKGRELVLGFGLERGAFLWGLKLHGNGPQDPPSPPHSTWRTCESQLSKGMRCIGGHIPDASGKRSGCGKRPSLDRPQHHQLLPAPAVTACWLSPAA